MSHIDKEKQKLVARIKRIRGQVDSIERSLTTGDDCADVLMLLANIRGGVNSLMAEILEDCLRENGIGCAVDQIGVKYRILVLPISEVRAREIIREVIEATPPE